MQLPPSEHQIWNVIRIALVGLILLVIFASQLVYKSPIAMSDLVTTLFILALMAGFDVAKMKLTKEQSK